MIDENKIKELGLEGYAVVRRDGLLVEGILPDYIDKETFSIMCATIFMGAVSTYNELHVKGPDSVTLKGFDRNIFLLPKESKEIYVLIIPATINIDDAVNNFLKEIK